MEFWNYLILDQKDRQSLIHNKLIKHPLPRALWGGFGVLVGQLYFRLARALAIAIIRSKCTHQSPNFFGFWYPGQDTQITRLRNKNDLNAQFQAFKLCRKLLLNMYKTMS